MGEGSPQIELLGTLPSASIKILPTSSSQHFGLRLGISTTTKPRSRDGYSNWKPSLDDKGFCKENRWDTRRRTMNKEHEAENMFGCLDRWHRC